MHLFHTRPLRITLLLLTLLFTLSLFSCATPGMQNDNIVNIGVTDTISSVNPFLMDVSEISQLVNSLQFLPLCELDAELNVVGLLAQSITTEDNLRFTVRLREDATWSDGTPITAADVVFSVLRYASPTVGNPNMLLYVFEGVDENTGFVKEGASEADLTGVRAVDEKTVEFIARAPMPLASFQNAYGRYIHVMPKHILGQMSEEELRDTRYFDAPTVVSGAYRLVDHNRDHYLSFVANENYFMGAPKIEKLNIKIVEAAGQYAGLRSGEIDFVQQTLGNIPNEDYAGIEALPHVTVNYGQPVTNQSVFLQTKNLTDVRVRQAILYAIDRQSLLDGLLFGSGEIVDGFLSSASPYYSSELIPVTQNVEKAKALLAQAAADGYDLSRPLDFYINSGDAVFVNGASLLAAQLAEVGLTVKLHTVDFATLMSVAGSTDYDLLAVQYTYSPIDPYPDVAWLLSGEGSWTGYSHPDIDAALAHSQSTDDVAAIRADYLTVDRIVQEDVPMFSAYVISAMGAVNTRLKNAAPAVYGSFNNIHEWEIVPAE